MTIFEIIIIGWIVNLTLGFMITIGLVIIILLETPIHDLPFKLEEWGSKTKNSKKEPWKILIPFSSILVMGQMLYYQYHFYKTPEGKKASYMDFIIWYSEKMTKG